MSALLKLLEEFRIHVYTVTAQHTHTLSLSLSLSLCLSLSLSVYSLGGENLAVAQNNYAVLWFKGKELNMVFGILLSVSRIVSFHLHTVGLLSKDPPEIRTPLKRASFQTVFAHNSTPEIRKDAFLICPIAVQIRRVFHAPYILKKIL